MKTVAERLRDAADLFEKRNADYGGNYLTFGPVMQAMLPNGMGVTCVEDWQRVILFAHLVTKLTRYAQNMARGKGHHDSLEDLAVYAIMQAECDDIAEVRTEEAYEEEVGAANEPLDPQDDALYDNTPLEPEQKQKLVTVPFPESLRDTHPMDETYIRGLLICGVTVEEVCTICHSFASREIVESILAKLKGEKAVGRWKEQKTDAPVFREDSDEWRRDTPSPLSVPPNYFWGDTRPVDEIPI